ncbi:uncharacterized protein LOC129570398 isoform X2 [Sitodiplosis mosellana]|uniref:uncharacterized protein LOC129570398 isoform X2 n=1 Tax=Sitodiplosis mosellana TaxID=263140 RepID=UPI002444FEC6|nr:uncharacterized protein LOC129570398 isoform X2 [Sitodiplosis mosellana]
MNSNWKQKLNQIFDAHESSIEEELLKVSLAFESCQPSANLTTEPSYFDFLCCRLSATCRKFQLGYTAAKNVEATDSTARTDNLTAVKTTPVSCVSATSTLRASGLTIVTPVIANGIITSTSANGLLTSTNNPTSDSGLKVTAIQADDTSSLTTNDDTTNLEAKATKTLADHLPSTSRCDASTTNEYSATAGTNGTTNTEDSPQIRNSTIVPSALIKMEKDSDDEINCDQAIEQAEDLSSNVNDAKITNDTESIEHHISNIAEEVSSAAVNSNLPEVTASAVVMTEEEIDRRIKNIIAAASHWQKNFERANKSGPSVKRKVSTDGEGAVLVKKLKLEELEMSLEEETPLNAIIPKNIDAKIHCKHPVYISKCMLCSKIDANLVDHYRLAHPSSEVFISRPSPVMIKRIRCQGESFECKAGIISGMCFFCEQLKKYTINNWKQHLLSHTGEFEYYCSKCLLGLSMKAKHEGCSKTFVKHIFASQTNNCALKGYICKLCNFLQINKDNLVKHLVNEHGSTSYEINKHSKKVTLIPNLRHITSLIMNGHEFIGSADRYRCGFGQCYAHFGDSVDLLEHFKHLHNRWGDFMCPHCSQLIRWRCFDDILNHYKLHGCDLFQCVTCQHTFGTEFDVILHIVRKHPMDDFQYRQNIRSHHYGIEKREVTILMECNLCNSRFDNVSSASTHFKKVHDSLNVDFTAIQLVKTTTVGMVTTFSVEKKPLLFRQFFVCQRCNQSILSKDQLVDHQKRHHSGFSIDLKLSKIVQLNSEKIVNSGTFTMKNSLYDRYLLFTCVHCDEAGDTMACWATVKEVHSHWKSTHSTRPFQFSAALLVSCHYCNFFSTFHGLKAHHEKKHAQNQTPFILSDLVDPNKCGICEYMGDGLAAHFKSKHELTVQINNLDPVSLSNEMLNKLTGININRKRQCGICNDLNNRMELFETDTDIEIHHKKEHESLELSSHKVFDKESLHCHFETSELYEFINHQVNEHDLTKNADFLYKRFLFNRFWRSKLSFGNGLVLNKCNTLKTDFDDSKAFQQLVESMLKEQKEKYQGKK